MDLHQIAEQVSIANDYTINNMKEKNHEYLDNQRQDNHHLDNYQVLRQTSHPSYLQDV